MPNIPGLGLPWPDSWKALLTAFPTIKACAKALNIKYDTAQNFLQRGSKPKCNATRSKFLNFGWTEAELPLLATRNYNKEDYWSPEDKARVRLFQIIHKHNPQKHWTHRFWDAMIKSSEAEIVNPEALTEWNDSRKNKTENAREVKVA